MYGCSTPQQRSRDSWARNCRLPMWTVLTLALTLTVAPAPSNAQVVFGSLVGNITDGTGGAIAGATVKATLTQTNETRIATANNVGEYTVSTVTPGTYTVEVTKEGFRAFVATNILVNQNNVVRVDAQLSVGATTEKVEVTAEAAAALQTDRADSRRDLYRISPANATAQSHI